MTNQSTNRQRVAVVAVIGTALLVSCGMLVLAIVSTRQNAMPSSLSSSTTAEDALAAQALSSIRIRGSSSHSDANHLHQSQTNRKTMSIAGEDEDLNFNQPNQPQQQETLPENVFTQFQEWLSGIAGMDLDFNPPPTQPQQPQSQQQTSTTTTRPNCTSLNRKNAPRLHNAPTLDSPTPLAAPREYASTMTTSTTDTLTLV